MIDLFTSEDAKKLFHGKKIVFLGDSNVRAQYKDMLCLLQGTKLLSEKVLKAKMENSVLGDKLVGRGELSNGRNYREEREASVNGVQAAFFFLTRVYDDYVQTIIDRVVGEEEKLPDIIVIGSCLWDVNRWGPSGVSEYKKNIVKLMEELKRRVPDSLVIWMTAPPIATEPRGGFLLKEHDFLKYLLRFHVVEANHYAHQVVTGLGFDVLDTHYHLMYQLHRRVKDGIHWQREAVRYVTCMLLTHISISFDMPLPRNNPKFTMPDFGSLVQPPIMKPVEVEDDCIIKDKPHIQSEVVVTKPEGTSQTRPASTQPCATSAKLDKGSASKAVAKRKKKLKNKTLTEPVQPTNGTAQKPGGTSQTGPASTQPCATSAKLDKENAQKAKRKCKSETSAKPVQLTNGNAQKSVTKPKIINPTQTIHKFLKAQTLKERQRRKRQRQRHNPITTYPNQSPIYSRNNSGFHPSPEGYSSSSYGGSQFNFSCNGMPSQYDVQSTFGQPNRRVVREDTRLPPPRVVQDRYACPRQGYGPGSFHPFTPDYSSNCYGGSSFNFGEDFTLDLALPQSRNFVEDLSPLPPSYRRGFRNGGASKIFYD